ncbi:pyruvate dehydrogenase [acetyl-transferring]-phosphatase 1, mitochondrial-like [Lingula anatina]|uniref:Pyruvate dehydrogenase [acetyl-transferring]-phosphatase 1, mitochondrial-like n=1 Tax=Lingula anatina TaxID=7574 RepID=A0A1S3JC19_LINAN|nr:pyruvate dehydrogenase [acetyl-transferring]-phosphatase 1, mitochondrial-like [Lingula anatina]|eukprot:XP_013407429.1 pyruvate dehydrogenase [acetyl-transferring]-phosphatase 1, mitochondrial-like [Lingula anatina]
MAVFMRRLPLGRWLSRWTKDDFSSVAICRSSKAPQRENSLRRYRYSGIDFPKFNKQRVTSMLRSREQTVPIEKGSILYYESNFLPSNDPIEDRHSVARCLQTDAMLFGVFDGHAGDSCAQIISERLFDYIAVSLMPPEVLDQFCKSFLSRGITLDLLQWYYHKKTSHYDALLGVHKNNLHRFAVETLSTLEDEFSLASALEGAFVRLDNDISSMAMPSNNNGLINSQLLNIALAGSCAIVAHVNGPHLHVANSGDCKAILGRMSSGGNIKFIPLSNDHSANNPKEVERIRREHPPNENVIRNQRLMGNLAPLRAFGDVCYKWPSKELAYVTKHAGKLNNPYAVMLSNYYTPPYLTAKPEVISYRLTPADRFMILATDGLWDMLTPEKVTHLISEHMMGKQTWTKYEAAGTLTLGKINSDLRKRRVGLEYKPEDINVATHLLRHALGGNNGENVTHSKLSAFLSLPPELSRSFRDDITMIIVFFDDNYLRDYSSVSEPFY